MAKVQAMQVSVRFFASLSEATGRSTCTVEVPPGAQIKDMVARLINRFPVLDGHQDGWHYAVNHALAHEDTPLEPGDQVAIFPYIAGG